MTFTTFILTYVFGGLTFLPLLLAAIVIPAWYLLPRIDDPQSSPGDGASKPAGQDSEREKDVDADEQYTGGGATSGTFAVLRSYHFQAATAALNAKHATTNGHNDAAAVDGASETSQSVYQSMYRSVFDRNKAAATTNPLTENDVDEGSAPSRVKRKPVPASVFYIVLRHGHLMLYDSAAQLEVRHVISLAQHNVSLSEGIESEVLTDGDLFIKRTAIVLTPVELLSGGHQAPVTVSKPFYLFSSTCTEKEEFYLALLHSRTVPPVPQPLDPADVIKLQSTLHSTSLTPETRALNAMVSRIFLALHRTPFLENLVRSKIEKKMARIQKPSFIASLELRSIDLGDAAPIVSNLRLRDLNISGDLTVACDIRYHGSVKVVIAAQAKLDLGTRFKARYVDLVLAASLQRLHGHMLFRIKPPPSNRIWFTFESMPEMEIKVEPVVSQRQITYTFILRAIEERIRGVVAETLVKPNWDDTPFFDTSGQYLRGGIWKDERVEASSLEDSDATTLEIQPEGSAASALLSTVDTESLASRDISRSGSVASSLAKESTKHMKRRAAAARHAAHEHEERPLPRPLRSPSFASPSPSTSSVTTDEANARILADDVDLQPKKWRIRSSQVQQAKRDAVEAVRELRDRTISAKAEEVQAVSPGNRHSDPELHTADKSGMPSTEHAEVSSLSVDADILDVGEVNTPGSFERSETIGSHGSGGSATRAQQQRKTILAATAAATTAAKNWSWNAIANRNKESPATRPAHGSGSRTPSSGQPMGRGQPLPPPGVPLPGPQKGLWSGLGTVKRKPVPPLPARRPRADLVDVDDPTVACDVHSEDVDDSADTASLEVEEHLPLEDDEFGPWRENSGSELNLALHSSPEQNVSTEDVTTPVAVRGAVLDIPSPKSPKVPPPLPARPKKQHDVEPVDGDVLVDTVPDAGEIPSSSLPDDDIATPREEVEEKFLQGHGIGEEDFEQEAEHGKTKEADVDDVRSAEDELSSSDLIDLGSAGHQHRHRHPDLEPKPSAETKKLVEQILESDGIEHEAGKADQNISKGEEREEQKQDA